MTEQWKPFRTPDLYFAAYLQTAGLQMKKSERQGDGERARVFFVFDVSVANIDELKAGWFNGHAKVPAQPYANAIKALKSICHMT